MIRYWKEDTETEIGRPFDLEKHDKETSDKWLDKVKQAREDIQNIGMGSYLELMKEIECNDREVRMSKKFATVILNKLIAESEE